MRSLIGRALRSLVPAQGNAIVRNVEDLQAEGRIKVARARLTVDDAPYLLGEGLLNATYWLDVRKAQGRKLGLQRSFGTAPTAAWNAFRQIVPWQQEYTQRPLDLPATQLAYAFLQANPASLFYPPAAGHPAAAARVRVAVKSARRATARYATRIHRQRALRRFIRRQAHS